MRKRILLLIAVLLFATGASAGSAEAKSIHMKIAGYLCGN